MTYDVFGGTINLAQSMLNPFLSFRQLVDESIDGRG